MKQKDQIKSAVKEKKESRRSQTPYPALQPKFNLKSRQDYMDTEYVNGVYDKEGNQLIRPLDEKEKERFIWRKQR